MSVAPTYEAIKCETSGKPLLRKKPLSSWALDNCVRMVYCHQSSVMFLREYGDVFNIHLWSILCLLSREWYFVSYLLSLSIGLDGNIIIFWSLMCSLHCDVTLWIVSIFRFEPWLFHLYYSEIVLVVLFLSADGTIMYDPYSTPMMWFRVRFVYITRIGWCCLFSYVASELWRDGLWARFLNLKLFLVRLWGTFVDKVIPSTL